MQTDRLLILTVCLLLACKGTPGSSVADHKALAERFFRGVYGCEPSVVAELGTENVFITYPIIEELFGTPALRGRDKVEQFATGFCNRWKDAEVTIHEAVAEGDRVVLVWEFAARNVASGERRSWGGISLFRFDSAGRIVAEIGEESEPGPIGRLARSPAAGGQQ